MQDLIPGLALLTITATIWATTEPGADNTTAGRQTNDDGADRQSEVKRRPLVLGICALMTIAGFVALNTGVSRLIT